MISKLPKKGATLLLRSCEEGVETEVYLKTSEELYNFLIKINPNFLNEK